MRYLLWVFLTLAPVFCFAQESEESQILAQREKSNAALREFNEDLNATFLTDDVLISTGAGTLISGKKALQDYIKRDSGPKMYWVRTPDEVLVNSETQLAWETGTWKGYVEGSEDSVVGGKYSAQWTKASGKWLIQSQLFVTLPENR
ncbi:YybH family protein [Algoriphagus sediminis]|uniref:Nuclear transport factor 2 family protein n=1 Tax=Algoriphagus sediminis TaxID=3057113 RepID=A0ABT7YD32_9BACT|nr:nuclear transport factor 2 family protein [Algoriphagus sediminis]MDN3204119.1 nuclear transport factor 2 family protein [Algoriphagus sediminis]